LREGAIQEQLIRARSPVLGLATLAWLGTGFYLASYWGLAGAAAAETGAIAMATGLGGLWLLRSPVLALIAMLTPLLAGMIALGVLTCLALAAPALCAVLIPHAVATTLMPAAATTLVMVYLFDLQVGAGNPPDAAAWNAMESIRIPCLVSLVLATVWRVLLLLPADLLRLQPSAVRSTDFSLLAAGVTALAACVACLVLLPLALGVVRLSEDHITNSNRRRELRERMLAHLDSIVVPRWAFSVTGIAGVLTALALFGDQAKTSQVLVAMRAQGLMLLATMVIAGVAGAFATRDWRGFVTCSIPAGLAAIWCLPVAHGQLFALEVPGTGTVLAAPGRDLPCVTASLAACACCLIAARMAAYRRLGNLPDESFAHAVREVGIPIVAVAGATALLLLPLGLGLLPVVCAAAALALTPALASLIELVFPKLRSVEELYGKKRAEPS
jgi:hypothetical protein